MILIQDILNPQARVANKIYFRDDEGKQIM